MNARRVPLALSAAALVTVEWGAFGIHVRGVDALVVTIGAVVAAFALFLLIGPASGGGTTAAAAAVIAAGGVVAAIAVVADEWSSRFAIGLLACVTQALLASRLRRDLARRRSTYGTKRPGDPLILAMGGFVAGALLLGSSVVLADDDDDGDTATGAAAVDAVATSFDGGVAEDIGSGGGIVATSSAPGGAPTTAAAGLAPPVSAAGAAAGAVPESLAVVKGGKIYLEGAVPTQEAADQIVALAGEVLGPANVINNYTVDPRASDPSLGNVRVDDPVLFETGTARIASDFEPLLNQALALMTIRPSVTLHVVGHTDDRGSEADNLDLSQRRAEAVVTWLTDRGIDASRLTSEGRGEAEPIGDNGTAEGRAANRRIQVFIANLLTAP